VAWRRIGRNTASAMTAATMLRVAAITKTAIQLPVQVVSTLPNGTSNAVVVADAKFIHLVIPQERPTARASLGRRATMMTDDPRPMSSAPLDGTPVRLFVFAGSAVASFGAWNAPGKHSERETIVRAGICSRMTQSSLMSRWDGNH
jgi:hypothetical protein